MPFQTIIGQPTAVHRLQSALAHQRLSHCYTFSGPPGAGKSALARALAQTLLCHNPKTQPPDACGQCDACLQVAHGTHPDLIEVVPEGASLKVQQIRALRQRLSRSAYSGGYSVVLIHAAERMTTESANALLKTLEEPLGPLLFVLLTQQAEALPDTIASRSQLVHFKAPEPALWARLLSRDADADPLRHDLALRYSAEHPLDPKALLEDTGDAPLLDQLEQAREALFAYLPGLARKHPGETLRFLQTYRRQNDLLRFMLRLVRSYYTDLLALSVYPQAPLHHPDQAVRYGESDATPPTLLRILEQCTIAQGRLAANVDPEQVLAVCLMQIGQLLRPSY